jgi:hypothetical protein
MGFILYNGKAEINITTKNGFNVLTINSTITSEIKKEVNKFLLNSLNDKFKHNNTILLNQSIKTLEMCENKIADPLLQMKILIETGHELKKLGNKAILNNLV